MVILFGRASHAQLWYNREMTEENPEDKKLEGVQYLKKPVIEETNIPNPIQGPVQDPNKLFHFMKDVHDSTVPKMWAIFLNEGRYSIGNEPIALGEHALPQNLNLKALTHYAAFFYAAHVILLTNHTNDDATPSEEDKQLIKHVEQALAPMEVNFADYVIVAGDHYWSMTTQNGTACHCGQQHYWGKE